jgi:hypothetical protein
MYAICACVNLIILNAVGLLNGEALNFLGVRTGFVIIQFLILSKEERLLSLSRLIAHL